MTNLLGLPRKASISSPMKHYVIWYVRDFEQEEKVQIYQLLEQRCGSQFIKQNPKKLWQLSWSNRQSPDKYLIQQLLPFQSEYSEVFQFLKENQEKLEEWNPILQEILFPNEGEQENSLKEFFLILEQDQVMLFFSILMAKEKDSIQEKYGDANQEFTVNFMGYQFNILKLLIKYDQVLVINKLRIMESLLQQETRMSGMNLESAIKKVLQDHFKIKSNYIYLLTQFPQMFHP